MNAHPRLLKLLALARDAGATKSEAAAAWAAIERGLAASGLTVADIESAELPTERYFWSYRNKLEYKLLNQIAYQVFGAAGFPHHHWKRKGQAVFGLDVTVPQREEITFLFEVHRRALAAAVDELYDAYIARQRIYPDDSPTESPEEARRADQARRARVRALANGIDLTQTRKAIR